MTSATMGGKEVRFRSAAAPVRNGAPRRAPGTSFGREEGVTLVLIVKNRLYAESLAEVLSADDGVQCLISAHEGEEDPGRTPVGPAGAVVVLLELTPGAADETRILSRIKARFPEGRIILLADGSSPSAEVDALVRGVQGIFPRTAGLGSLRRAIAAVGSGEIWADREVTGLAINRFITPAAGRKREDEKKKLTRRETQILALVAGGLKNRQIAGKLFISEQTVKVHLSRVFPKIGASDRLQAALYAIHHDIVPKRVFPASEGVRK